MGLFSRRPKRRPYSGDLGELLLQGQDMIVRTGDAHQARWGLGSGTRWNLDQTTGLLSWTFPDRTAVAPAQIIGTYSPSGGTWMWGWANSSVLPALVTASEQVRAWGAANGHAVLSEPKLEILPEQAEELAAIAFRITRATGYYRAPGGSSFVYLTFGPVTLTSQDGTSETFTLSVGEAVPPEDLSTDRLVDEVRERTHILATEEVWEFLRRELRDRGYDPSSALVGGMIEGEEGDCTGVVAVPPGRLIAFEFDEQERATRWEEDIPVEDVLGEFPAAGAALSLL